MPDRFGGIVTFVTEAPTIEIYDGVAHVVDRSGTLNIERAMPISCFIKYVERAQLALRRHAAGDETIYIGN